MRFHLRLATWSAPLLLTPLAGAQLSVELVSRASGGSAGNAPSGIYPPSISSEGRFIAFDSDATDLVPGDTNGWTDSFLRDTVAGTTQAISVTPTGAMATFGGVAPRVSWDGRYVAFLSN